MYNEEVRLFLFSTEKSTIILNSGENLISVNVMKTKYKKGEDFDLSLRLYENGIQLIRKSEIITNHYTELVLYKCKNWKAIWTTSIYHYRSVIYRDHIFTKQMYYLLWRNDKISIVLFLVVASCFAAPSKILYLFSIYLISIVYRIIKQKSGFSFLKQILYYIIADSLNIFYAFTLYPMDEKEEYFIHF